jgi:hypothetical protein
MMNLAIAAFTDISGLKQSGQLTSDGPYALSDDEATFIADLAYQPIIRRIAASPCFPFEIGELFRALRKAERFYSVDPAERPRYQQLPQYAHSGRLMVQVVTMAKRMAETDPSYARLAFGLSDSEIEALLDAGDLTLFEAAGHIRLVFRSAKFSDVMSTSVTFVAQKRKDRTQFLTHMARLAGLSVAQRIRGLG